MEHADDKESRDSEFCVIGVFRGPHKLGDGEARN